MRPARLEWGTCCIAVHGAYFHSVRAPYSTQPQQRYVTVLIYIAMIKAHTGTARGGGTLARLQGPERFFIMGSASFVTAPSPWKVRNRLLAQRLSSIVDTGVHDLLPNTIGREHYAGCAAAVTSRYAALLQVCCVAHIVRVCAGPAALRSSAGTVLCTL
jgi:hypothetical protein